jgi:hypothetical protein
MKKIIFLIFISIYSHLLAQDTNTTKTNKVFVINYIKNIDIKNNIKQYYTSFDNKFIDVEIIYKEFKDDEFYKNYRSKGLSFLNKFMLKNDYKVILIFYQKRKDKKITLISQKVIVNAIRNISISSKKFSKKIVYEKIISKSLQMLGEFLMIHPNKRII